MAEERSGAVNAQNRKRQAKKKRKAEKNSFSYACFLIAIIIVITSVLFVAVDKRNKSLLPAEKKTTNEIKAEEKPSKENKETATGEATPETTLPPETTTEPETAVQVMKPGTIENPTIIEIDEENWHLTLVNSCYRIPDDYEPDLVYVCSSGERLDRKVAKHYEAMYNAALKEGIELTPYSGYRSYELQEKNYNNKISFYESQGYSYDDAKVKAATIIMPPGSSEHNLGYAMDIVCVDEWFEDTEQFRWLTEHAADYGFIMRYPKDKQDITKVIYEPWHWRYVGVELAKELKASGQVLEEYMGVA